MLRLYEVYGYQEGFSVMAKIAIIVVKGNRLILPLFHSGLVLQ